jgi:hypothetical protein
MSPVEQAESPMGERMTRVETRLDGVVDAIDDVKDMIRDQNKGRIETSRARRAAMYTVIGLFFCVPSTATGAIALYHLVEPSHTIVQNLPTHLNKHGKNSVNING